MQVGRAPENPVGSPLGGPTGFSGARRCASLARLLLSGPLPDLGFESSTNIVSSGGKPKQWSCTPKKGTPKIFGLNMARRRALPERLSWSKHSAGNFLAASFNFESVAWPHQGGTKLVGILLSSFASSTTMVCNSFNLVSGPASGSPMINLLQLAQGLSPIKHDISRQQPGCVVVGGI